MFFDLIALCIEVCTTVLVAACLLRFYLHFLKINFAPTSGNPFSQFLHPLTDWFIRPLGKIIPFGARIDINSLLASYLLILAKISFLQAFSRWSYPDSQILIIALFDLFDLALSGLIGLLLVYVFFSWTNTYSATQELFHQMLEPLLKPLRKISPKISGVDFSALILMLLIQMSKVILGHIQIAILNSL
ncbi:YggT family protein [Polynucleobacter sp. MWH-UH2A]|uniref:YggT family protein n=1 Tax=Polynucleobacter sp. MWH-UH2A TaxID=1855617 RepID=UPI001BFE960B|nr:YggT family protein [Polynucleobacter sp. MWH-UH2A]QWD64670.1 YggT family protein [Polynucleobacter sp. MWH-UH2A]